MSGTLTTSERAPRLRPGAALPLPGALAEARFGWADALVALGAVAVAGAIGADHGGHFPTAWGWSALALCWVAATALVLRSAVVLSVLERSALAAFAGLAVWIGLSSAWSASVPASALEVERALVYPVGLLALLLVARRRSLPRLLGGLHVGIALVSAYALATRLFPDRLGGTLDAVGGYRLSRPVGYWNALGLFAAMGALLAVGLAARSRRPAVRALAAASLVVLLPTLYFTFSRGAWLALGVGLAAAIALDPRRLQLAATLLVVAPAPALAVWLGSRSHALTRLDHTRAQAAVEGHRLALAILVLAVAAGGLTLALASAEGRISIARRHRGAYRRMLLLAVVALLAALFARYGTPPTLAAKAYRAFNAPPAQVGVDLNRRLFDLSSSGRTLQWRVAWQDYTAHPLLGSGAGTYEQFWLRHRPVAGKVRDAHNLYLETLAELGPAGLALLLAALTLPLAALPRARRHPLVPAAFGAYAAYLLHAAYDWDWEMTGVTLTALFCAGAILVAARSDAPRALTGRGRAALGLATLAVAAAAFVGLLGNLAVSKSVHAARTQHWQSSAAWAHRAARYAPWSSAPWEQLALAQARAKDARPLFLEAIAKDRRNWQLWLELAWASKGRAQRQALAEATRLNPLSPEIAQFRAQLSEGER